MVVAEDVSGMRPESGPECLAASPVASDPCTMPMGNVVVPNLVCTDGHHLTGTTSRSMARYLGPTIRADLA